MRASSFSRNSRSPAVRVSDAAVCEDGCVFTLSVGEDSAECATRLLGEHNILDIALAAAMAYCLGVPLRDIARAVAGLEPVEHRLQLIHGNGVKIIDDTFNCNPDGARCALDVLSLFAGRKVVVTPGMVELGGLENDANKNLGRNIAKYCDVAILVGSRAKTIKAGATEAGMSEDSIRMAASLEAAKKYLTALDGGCVILFENDLPDNYA